jgi:hypothetical protein
VPPPLGVEVDPLELELGMELEPLGLVVVDELEVEPDADGLVLVDGAVLGDADGGLPLGVRSPVRSVRDSLQAVSRPRLSATAKMAVSILFISMPPPCVGRCATVPDRCNGCAGAWRLDRPRVSQYQCGVIRAEAKEMRA